LINRFNLLDQSEDLVEFFNKIDKDKSQELSKDELKKGLKDSGMVLSDKEFEELFEKLDADKNECISYSEYLAGAVGINLLNNEALLEEAFNFMDRKKKGYLTKDVLEKLLGTQWISKVQLANVFKEIDTNKDDKVCLRVE
jgi:Ca2+-binding EF-hand superfamily protein